MSEMIERMAKAMAEADARGETGYRAIARAALEAMRGTNRPSLSVAARAALMARGGGCSQEDAFLAGLRAMIDANLSPSQEELAGGTPGERFEW